MPDDRDPVVAAEDRLERLGEEAVVVGYQHPNVGHGSDPDDEMCLVKVAL